MYKVTLDKERHLRYDLNAMILYEKLTGNDIIELFDGVFKKIKAAKNKKPVKGKLFSLEDTRALLYAGLKHEDPALTLEKVGGMIDLYGIKLLNEAIIIAWSKGNNKDEEPFLSCEPSAESTLESQTKNSEG